MLIHKPKGLTFQTVKSHLTGFMFYVLNGHRVNFASRPVIDGLIPRISCAGTISFGAKCVFRSFHIRQYFTSYSGAVLEIGHGAFFNNGVNICASIHIKIGRSVKIGDMVYIYDTDFHPVAPDRPIRKQPVIIGDNVWIGANSMILAGARIGDHSVIAAGSIVTGDIPARSVAAGNPARVIKTFEASDDWIRP